MMSKYGQMGIQLSGLVENIVGKGEIALFPQSFQKLLLMRQNEYLWSRGLTLSQTTNLRFFQTERVCRQQL